MNGSEADNYELRLNYSKEVLAKSVCQNGAKEEYQDTRLNRQQLGTESLKASCQIYERTWYILHTFFMYQGYDGVQIIQFMVPVKNYKTQQLL
jgi:hypothetical protein